VSSYPTIIDPQPTFESLTEAARQMKMAIEQLNGSSGGGGSTRRFMQIDQPINPGVGDVWADLSDAGRIRLWNGHFWVDISDSRVSSLEAKYEALSGQVAGSDYAINPATLDGSLISGVTAVDSNSLGGVDSSYYSVFLEEISGSGVGSLAKANCFSSDYSLYEVVLENIRGSVNGASLYMRWYVDGAYQSTNYSSYSAIYNPGGQAGVYNTTYVDILIGGRLSNSSTWGGVCGVFQFINPAQSDYAPNMIGRTSFADAAFGPNAAWTFISAMRTVKGAVTGFQFYPSSGTLTGTVKVQARK